MNEELRKQIQAWAAEGLTEDQMIDRLRTMAMPSSAPTPTPEPSGFAPARVAIGQGTLLGFGDELEALARGAGALVPGGRSPGEAFSTGLEEARTDVRAFREAHPVGSVALEVGGGLLTGGAGALRSAGRAGLRTGGRLLGRALGTTAARGAVEGGVAGAGAAQGGVPERLLGGALGAAAGAATGGLAQGAGFVTRPARQRAAGAIRSALERQGVGDIPGALAKLAPGESMMDIPAPVRDRLGRAAVGAGAGGAVGAALDPEGSPLQGAAAGAGLGAALGAGRGGTPIQRLARGAQSFPGEASEEIRDFLVTRSGRSSDEIKNVLQEHAGLSFEDAIQTADELAQRQLAKAAPLYREAYKHTVPIEGPLEDALRMPQFRQAYEHGRRIAELEGVTLPNLETYFREAREAAGESKALRDQLKAMGLRPDQVEGLNMPEAAGMGEAIGDLPVQALDYMKRGIDDMIDLRRSGKAGLGQQEARVLRRRLSEVLGYADEQVPEYNAARAAYAGDAGVREAFDAGREGSRELGLRAFTREDPRAIRKALSDMSASEQEMYRRGALDDVFQVVDRSRDARDLTRVLFDDETMRSRLRILFPDEGAFNEFADAMISQRRMRGTEQFVLGGSPTARIQAEQRQIMGGGAGEALSTGARAAISPQWTAMGLASRAGDLAETRSLGRTAGEMVPFLTATAEDAPRVTSELDRLLRREARRNVPFRLGAAAGAIPLGLGAGRLVGEESRRRPRNR